MCYSIEPRDRRYAKGYEFLSCAKNAGKKLSNKIVKNVLIVLRNLQQMQ